MDEWVASLAPQLAALTALVDHDGYMTGAAEALGVPQSSMSRRIHSLEQTLRIPLVTRDGRAVRLTPAAIRLADGLRQPLAELERAVEEAAGDADPDHGTVRFGFPLTLGSGRVPELLADFNRRHPGVHLQLKQAHGAELVDDLRRGALDLALTIPPPDTLPHRVLAQQRICVTVPATHRLAAERSATLTELRGERFIANPVSYHLRRVTEQWCADAGFAPDIGVEITEFDTIRQFVGRGLGVALLPETSSPAAETVDVGLSGDYTRPIALASATARLAPPAKRFAAYLTTHLDGRGTAHQID